MRSRGRWFGLAAFAALLLASVPFLLLASLPPDAPAPSRIAPYVESGRQSLLANNDLVRSLPHHLRYVGARCSGSGVALLYEVRLYPFVSMSQAYAVSGDWPPGEEAGFGGAYDVADFDASLRDDWVNEHPWGACEPA